MSDTKHTPGNWIVQNGSVYVQDGNEYAQTRIASMDRGEPNTRPVERDANARLIAAAPELLDAAKQVAETRIGHGRTFAIGQALDCLEKAIPKAEA